MTVHTKRVLSHLTPQFLAAEIYEIIKVVEKYPDASAMAFGDQTVGDFRKIQLTFHGSRKVMKEFIEVYVGKFLRGYVQRFRIMNPVEQMQLMESTEPNEWAACDLLVTRFKKERGEVPAEEVAKLDQMCDEIQARMRQRIEDMAGK